MEETLKWIKMEGDNIPKEGYYLVSGYAVKSNAYEKQIKIAFTGPASRGLKWYCVDSLAIEYYAELPESPIK